MMARSLDLGGTERQMTQIAKALDRSRFTPHVACFHDQGMRAKELNAAGVPVVRLPVHSFVSLSVVRGARMLGEYVRRHGIELVHTFDVPMNLFGVPAARLWRVPFVLSSQRAHRDLTPGAMRHLLRLTDRMVDAIVVNAEAVGRELVEEERVPPGLIRLCRNGIDMSEFRRLDCPRSEVLRDADVVVGALCAMRPEKNLQLLLRAYARVRRPGVKLAIVGSGPALAGLRDLARELALGEDCIFEPATAEVPRWLSAIDIFVLPSSSEALSNSLMEAMACGCAVAASNVGGNSELVRHMETGMLFEAGDVDGLADALARLIASADLRRSMAAAACDEMRRRYSLEASAECMAGIYEEVMGT